MMPFTTDSRLRKVAHWLALRDTAYIGLRSIALLRRYGVTTARARNRVVDCVDTLAKHGCWPTFPTPGQVVGGNGPFCRQLQHLGAELAVHGYHHLDFRSLTPDESRRQFTGAAAAYLRNGIQFEGFRCPYLSYTEALNQTLPNGQFHYSSNKAVWWDVVPSTSETAVRARPVFQALSKFYQAKSSATHVAVPSMSGDLVEIPVCVPDDLQLVDGLGLDERGLRQAWIDLLHQTHRRGELFDLLFHPESFEQCGPALVAVLREAHDLTPPVWITQLRDVNRWWREKAAFAVDTVQRGPVVQYMFRCSERATILIRNLETQEPTSAWHKSYRVLKSRTLQLRPNERPFIGVSADVPSDVAGFLREQGYIVDAGPDAACCATYLNSTAVAGVQSEVALIDMIETSDTPLVRFWRWPEGTRSALCVTGDLDALSLTDYFRRVFALS